MRLRNKKTGEIKNMWNENICLSFGDCNKVYYSLAELNGEWEDYTPTEPLIKDEKIRKAVRAWAELNCSHKLHQFNDYQLEDENDYLIEFADSCFTNLKIGKNYTIAELCGEEKE